MNVPKDVSFTEIFKPSVSCRQARSEDTERVLQTSQRGSLASGRVEIKHEPQEMRAEYTGDVERVHTDGASIRETQKGRGA